jgi:hypothetical protein
VLRARGAPSFLDRDALVAGVPCSQSLEDALRSVRAVAVFIGPNGFGAWQKREMYFALDRQAQEESRAIRFPAIPVLLRKADITAGFLFLNTWVDLRKGVDGAAVGPIVRAVKDGVAHMPPIARPWSARSAC